MSELETALLIVLVIILIVIAWQWYRYSLAKLNGSNLCRTSQLMLESKNEKPVIPRGALNPNTSLVSRAGATDGYTDYTTDSYDSYVDASESFNAGHLADSATAYAVQDELSRTMVGSSVVQSHNEYIKGLKGRSTSHSMQSLTDHPDDVNPWSGLRRPRMHIAKPEQGARVVASLHHTQYHPGTEMRWSSSSNDHSVCG